MMIQIQLWQQLVALVNRQLMKIRVLFENEFFELTEGLRLLFKAEILRVYNWQKVCGDVS